MKETILQFGEGNFLRAFLCDMVDGLRRAGLYAGSIAVVQPRAGGKCHMLADQGLSYHLLTRGIQNGEATRELRKIEAITAAIDPYREYDRFMAYAESPHLRFFVSNTTEAGIAFAPEDKLTDAPPLSFPGKVTQFLWRRYQSGLPGLIFLPCELIDQNGDRLLEIVCRYVALWGLPVEFEAWVRTECRFANTLVDRICSGFPEADKEALWAEIGMEDKLMTETEPYHLWAIQGNFEDELPLRRGGYNVVWTDDVTPYKKLKVRILNGSHSSLCPMALLMGVETVGDAMADPELAAYHQKLLSQGILPTLESPDASAFAAATLERFGNPFLHHKFASISLNQSSKWPVRVLPTLRDADPAVWPLFTLSLAATIALYRTAAPSDDPAAIQKLSQNTTAEILADKTLWGEDLTDLLPLVEGQLATIEEKGMREALKCI